MTVSTSISSKTYDGTGSQTEFPTEFEFFTDSDIEVIERVVATGVETTKALTTDYTVSGGSGAAGTVTAVTAPPSTVTWTIRRVLAETQGTALPVAGALPSTAVEQALDRGVMIVQQHSDELGRKLGFPATDADSLSSQVPSSVDRASKFLAFDSSGNPIASAGPSGDSSIPVSSFVETILDDANAAAVRTTIGLGSAAVADTGTASGNVPLATDVILQGKHTIWIPAGAMRPTVSNGCDLLADVETTAGRPDMQVLDFDASADEHAQFQIAMPKSWDLGTLTFQVFWTSTATDTDGVAWGLQAVAVSNDETIDIAYGTAVVVTDDNISAAEDLLVTAESADLTVAGTPADGDVTFFRIFRDVSDANDVMTEDARLIGVQLFYTVDAATDA